MRIDFTLFNPHQIEMIKFFLLADFSFAIGVLLSKKKKKHFQCEKLGMKTQQLLKLKVKNFFDFLLNEKQFSTIKRKTFFSIFKKSLKSLRAKFKI